MEDLHYQVVIMDKKGYILGYENYELVEMDKMMDYIESKTTDTTVNKIEITRWSHKTGERV